MDSLHEKAQKIKKEILFCTSEKERIEKEMVRLQIEKENNDQKLSEHSLTLEECMKEIRLKCLE